eukprot:GHRQ01024243.1.p1 GENE.GHRQ01024243.1~~GHRQ01024243.1.p1  ORF type:complete len:113 (+),score=34.04 GHRQ01024243.1:393-731(+)
MGFGVMIGASASLCRSMKVQFESTTQQELAIWHEQKQQYAAAKAAAHRKFGEHVAWQLVQLSERVIEYRAATAGQAVPRRDWRAWISLFLAGWCTRLVNEVQAGPVHHKWHA